MKLEIQGAPEPKGRAYIDKTEARQDWNTSDYPQAPILTMVRSVFDGPIDLDPCSNPESITAAASEVWFQYGEVEPPAGRNVIRGSGLVIPWQGRVFVNPPFDHISKWVQKCRGEHDMRGAEVLLLGPAGVSTKWFHAHVPSSDAWMFWKGRFKFLNAKNGCPFNPLFAYWGPNADRFEGVFGQRGMVIRPKKLGRASW